MNPLNDAFLLGLRGVGKGVVAGGKAVGRGVGRAVGLLPGGSGLPGKALKYGGRHVASGTMIGGMAMSLGGQNVPITRHISNVGQAVGQSTANMAQMRQGEGISDPNAPNEIQARRLAMKTANMSLRQAAQAIRLGYSLDDVRAGMSQSKVEMVNRPSPVTGASTSPEVDVEALDRAIKRAAAEGVYTGSLDKVASFTAALATAAATSMVGAGAQGIASAYRGHVAENTWKELTKDNRRFDNARHRENFEVIKRYSPDLAANKTVLKSYLTRMEQMDQVPLEMVGDMVGAQRQRDDGNLGMLGARAGVQSFGSTLGAGLNKRRELEGMMDNKRRELSISHKNRLGEIKRQSDLQADNERGRENRAEFRAAWKGKDTDPVIFPKKASSPLMAAYDEIDEALASVNVGFDRK